MPTVFVSQLPHKLDRETGTYVPRYNIHPASLHGELKILMPPQAPFVDSSQIIPQLGAALNYSFANGDCLLLLGDTVVQSCVVALASQKGRFRVLRWDRNIGAYSAIVIDTRVPA